MTTYHFSGTVAWNRLGPFITTGRGLSTKTITDPATGLTPAGLTQGGVAVTKITADLITGQWSFTTTDVPGVLMDWGAGPNLVGANELPGMILTAAAPTDAAVAALVGTASSTRSAMDGRYVLDGALVYSAADYASLSACVAAVPTGATIKLPKGTYSVTSSIGVNKSLTFVGDGPKSTIVDFGSTTTGFTSTSTAAAATLHFEKIGFTGSGTDQFAFSRQYHRKVTFVDCRFSGFPVRAINITSSDLNVTRCEFVTAGDPGQSLGIYAQGGSSDIAVRDCTFRYLFRGVYSAATAGQLSNVVVSGCYFDGGWMYLKQKATGSGGTVSYTSTSLTDTAASFPAFSQFDTVRALTVKQAGTLTINNQTQITDASANFVTAGVKVGDILRTSTMWAVVHQVTSATALQVEEWLSPTTFENVARPTTGTSYTIYGLIVGRVSSNTSTVLTIDHWQDWDGNHTTPASGTLYEVASKGEYQGISVPGVDKIRITNNTIRRVWADAITSGGATSAIIANNHIYDTQDVGITVGGPNVVSTKFVVTNNVIEHVGTAGIWVGDAFDSLIDGNSISEHGWMLTTATADYSGIIVRQATRLTISNNTITNVLCPNVQQAIHIQGSSGFSIADVAINDNRISGYGSVQDIKLSYTTLSGITGRFQTGQKLTLALSAVGPLGTFSGSGSPETVVPAAIGSTYRRIDGGAGTSSYVKESGTGATGWIAK